MKKYQKGVAGWVFLGVISVLAFVVVASYVTNYNYGNRAETQIEATWENNENILAQYSLKVMEVAQVPGRYRDDVTQIYQAALEGRYGDDGSQAMFQWIQEQNPQVDASLYARVQQVMEAGRNEFQVNQTRLVDLKRAYNTNLGYLWKGMWLNIAGYPTINVGFNGGPDDFAIITSGHASEAFETGVDQGITLPE